MPVNLYVNKNEVIVRYDSTNYTWSDAVANDIVLDFVYKWNRTTQSYNNKVTFDPGDGYWVWSYHNDVELIISGNATGDDNITDLLKQWNIMGLPFNVSVAKEDLIIQNNSIDYSWNDAVSQGIILGYIYGWDRNSQRYILVDNIEPGQGYWMYAYYDCTLKK